MVRNQLTPKCNRSNRCSFTKKTPLLGVLSVGCLFLRSPSQIPYRTELIPRAPNGGVLSLSC
jgi:hypothetical protein